MNMKCKDCGTDKPKTSDFFRPSNDMKSGFRSRCKECEKVINKKYRQVNQDKIKKQAKEYKKKYYEQNREQLLEGKKLYYEQNKDSLATYKKQWYEENKENISRRRKEQWRLDNPLEEIEEGMKKCCKCKKTKPATSEYFHSFTKAKDGFKYSCIECRHLDYRMDSERIIIKSRQYYQDNKEIINQQTTKYTNRKYKEDLNFRLLTICRSRVTLALKGKVKSKNTLALIGGSVEVLRKHLESQFKDGMSWENHGEWHIDHIKPCAIFDFTDKEQQHECFHYTNLQPLWAEENMRKSAKYGASI